MSRTSLLLRRRRYFVVRIADVTELDLRKFLQTRREGRRESSCTLLCPVRGENIAMSPAEMQLAMKIPADAWIALSDVAGADDEDRSRLLDLAQRGILLSDPAPADWHDLAASEDALEKSHWADLTAVYHARTRWQGTDVMHSTLPVGNVRLDFQHLRWLRGDAPQHFVKRPDAHGLTPLRVPALDDDFFRTLLKRQTTRAYRLEEALPIDALEQMLYVVFGTQGTAKLAEGLVAVKRTSPSGGALHPIDAYVLVLHVQGVAPGLYHYESQSHSLACLETMSTAEARTLASEFVAGQTFFAEAHAMVIQVARFDRSFWKYGQDAKAYNTVLLDAGHLSQTFYLTATHLGFGAFYTAAINDMDIARRLRLDPFREGVLGINGIGITDSSRNELHFVTEPYRPARGGTHLDGES